MKIGTLTTGVGVITTINIQYLPQYLYYIAATQLTGLKVIVEGDGTIIDLDAAGLNALSGIRRFGAVANSYLIPLSDGLVTGKTVSIEATNSAAQTPDLFAFSLQKANVYIPTMRMLALANSTVDIMDFAYLGIASPVTADIITVEFADGTVQRFQFEELLGWVTIYSNEVDSYVIDNIEGNIRKVSYYPSTNRSLYVTRFANIGNII